MFFSDPRDPASPPTRGSDAAVTYSEQRRRVLASRDWAGLSLSASSWTVSRRPAELTLSTRRGKRPRARSPSPEYYTPLTPPPRGGFLRGSSVEVGASPDETDNVPSGAVSVVSTGDFSSEVGDAVILLPERGRPDATGATRRSDAAAARRQGLEDPRRTSDRSFGSRLDHAKASPTAGSAGLQRGPSQWSARKRLGTIPSAANGSGLPPHRPPAPLWLPKTAEIDETLLDDLSGVRGLSLEDQHEPNSTPAGMFSDSLEILDFSPRRPGADHAPGCDEQQRDGSVVEELAGAADPERQRQHPDWPAALSEVKPPALVPAVSASATRTGLAAAVRDPALDLPSAEWNLELLSRGAYGSFPAPPDLAPLRHLSHLRDEAALHQPDEVETVPSVAALEEEEEEEGGGGEGNVLLVSEHMGLGCDFLTAEQADKLVLREMMMRTSGVLPLEWYSRNDDSDSEGEPTLGARTDVDDADADTDGDEGWDSHVQYAASGSYRRPLRVIPGVLFGPDDDSGILEP